MNLSMIDIIFILLIALFVIRCFLKGFVSEVLSMAAVILGLIASLYFYKTGGEFICVNYMPQYKVLAEILAFVGLFLIVFIIIKILEVMLKGIVEGIRLGKADRFLGLIFGFAEGLVVVSFILFILTIQPLFNPESLLSGSFFARAILPFINGSLINGNGMEIPSDV